MEQVFQALAAASLIIASGLAGLALGVSGSTVAHLAPEAFERLDYERADSLVRRLVKSGLPWVTGFALVAGAFAIAGGALGSGVILIVAGAFLFFVRWILDPLPKKPRMAGATRKISKQRIMALQVMTLITLLFPAALVALALRI
jgi:hypothetical protein